MFCSRVISRPGAELTCDVFSLNLRQARQSLNLGLF
jgi:hypothetical protein